jgi:hypothetical protein
MTALTMDIILNIAIVYLIYTRLFIIFVILIVCSI